MHDGAPRWSRRNRTIVFPSTVRTVHPGSFNLLESLRAALMNEGLETLGTYKYDWSAAEPSDTAGSEKCACPQRFEGSKKTPSWAANNSQILYYQKDYSHWELVFLRERTGECTFPVNAENDRKSAFSERTHLKTAEFTEGLGTIQTNAFRESGIERVVLHLRTSGVPGGLRVASLSQISSA